MLWKIVLLIVGIFCLVYYAMLCAALRKWNSTFSRFWLGAGGLCVLGVKVLQYDRIPVVLKILMLFLAIAFLATESVIVAGMFRNHQKKCRYLVVLGSQVSGRKITDSLRRRLDEALKYLEKYPDTRVVVSGGRGKGEEIPEAEAMAGYLTSHGIEKSRIFLEKRSRTTQENLRYSLAFIEDATKPVGIVSNHFHLYRACQYAKKLGYEQPCPIAAGCNPLLVVNYMVRECMAVWKMWLLNCIS